ncbi:hypothetical protein [Leptospira noguchii]|uniref:Uncharacterized protein n=1 Tax=Leptospira noguchii TaxID=28182 RepID=A0A9Q8VW06_9LEPT|nr:hypothetical protein [Leptospira noguchii]TQE76083.1 hypothetical protein FF021_09865 [Leptospira noguchii]UOG30411.1 hypothetical protein MAL06_17885 [Leptospira noguchii]UOG34114.1 hypothetical protein MAL02_16580 [Leptospira noguchii]UOG44977.1 hypothetical protein MAL01_16925 [Leptospira noguchii]UOG52540.1 hypothetical protein MAL09_18605 [Leptospira noguchii]
MTRKNIQKFVWILFFLGFGCRTKFNDFDRQIYVVEGLKKQNIQEEKISEKREYANALNSPIIINERFEILDLTVSKSLFKDVESKFGNQYIRNYFNYEDIEINYESLGLSFVFDDYTEKIRKIGIKPPCRATTSRGITLDKSTLQEAIDIYEKATSYYSGEYSTWNKNEPYLCIKYGFRHSFHRIQFCVEKNPSIPENPVDKTFYLKQKIQKIYLY